MDLAELEMYLCAKVFHEIDVHLCDAEESPGST